MNLTNLADGTVIVLPDDLLWIDEHAWTPAIARVEYLLTGALLVESAARSAGRPITLKAEPDMAWITRAVLDALYIWASEPNRTFQLELHDGRSFTVAFRHHESALEAEPVLGFPSRSASDWYCVSLRLMEV